ncbi:MAG: hypothetical protein LKJ88_07425 [Bacilli bacterium]|jgi:hypothetical protein|nr:hypothetical protein [Bacilli bacterium]
MNKAQFNNHLLYHWPLYLLWAGGVFAVWLTGFSQHLALKDNEQLRFVVCSENFVYDKAEKELKEKLPSLTEQKVEQITAEVYSLENLTDEILAIRSIDATDFLILPESKLKKDECKTYFLELNSDLKAAFNGYQYYEEDGLSYGIKLTHEGRYFSYMNQADTNAYILFFFPDSVNLGQKNNLGNLQDDVALQSAIYLAGKEGS